MDLWIPDENQDFNLPFYQFLSKQTKNISHHYIDIKSATSLFPFQHNFKKIRNNILKSCVDENGTRCLELAQGKNILWEHFVSAFNYDQGEMSLSYHEKLTLKHFQLDPASKMRNQLAKDVLDKNMLNLMKVL